VPTGAERINLCSGMGQILLLPVTIMSINIQSENKLRKGAGRTTFTKSYHYENSEPWELWGFYKLDSLFEKVTPSFMFFAVCYLLGQIIRMLLAW
jgi:hypothetical protein